MIMNYIISYTCRYFQSSQPFFKTKLITITSSLLHSEVSGSFDVDCNCPFSDPEVSWDSLAALIILSSLSLKNR